jgi:hypothetical protein
MELGPDHVAILFRLDLLTMRHTKHLIAGLDDALRVKEPQGQFGIVARSTHRYAHSELLAIIQGAMSQADLERLLGDEDIIRSGIPLSIHTGDDHGGDGRAHGASYHRSQRWRQRSRRQQSVR